MSQASNLWRSSWKLWAKTSLYRVILRRWSQNTAWGRNLAQSVDMFSIACAGTQFSCVNLALQTDRSVTDYSLGLIPMLALEKQIQCFVNIQCVVPKLIWRQMCFLVNFKYFEWWCKLREHEKKIIEKW